MSAQLTINGAALSLTDREMLELAGLTDHPGWPILLRILDTFAKGARAELEDSQTPLDNIRGLQGRLSVARDLRLLLEEGVTAWLKEQQNA